MSLAGIERWSGRVTSSIARARFNGLPQASRPAVLRPVERRAKWSEPFSTGFPIRALAKSLQNQPDGPSVGDVEPAG